MQEQTRVKRWLNALLAGDSTLVALLPTDGDGNVAIYEAPGPEAGAWPRVTWISFGMGHDVRAVGTGPRILTDLLYQVKAVGKTESYLDLEAIADRVDLLLDGTRGGPVSGGGQVLYSARVQPFDYPEVEQGVSFRHLGGIYRILANQS